MSGGGIWGVIGIAADGTHGPLLPAPKRSLYGTPAQSEIGRDSRGPAGRRRGSIGAVRDMPSRPIRSGYPGTAGLEEYYPEAGGAGDLVDQPGRGVDMQDLSPSRGSKVSSEGNNHRGRGQGEIIGAWPSGKALGLGPRNALVRIQSPRPTKKRGAYVGRGTN